MENGTTADELRVVTSGSEVAIDLTTAQELIDLRVLLDAAVNFSKKPGPLREVLGPVLLDGALERAIFLAGTRASEIRSEKDRLDDVLNRLIGQRQSRPQQHIASVKNLHKARNAAQHQGVRCHPEDIEGWSISVSAMVNWLVIEFVGAELSEVTLGSAVRDGTFRDKLVDAEADLECGDHRAAVRSARSVMEEAFRAWQVQVVGIEKSTSIRRGGPVPSHTRDLEDSLMKLRRGVLVASLAPDAGESAWFVDQWSGFGLDRAEAERYVRFVIRWVSAFEATPARSRLYRHARATLEQRMVRSGEGPATVDHVEIEKMQRHEGKLDIRVHMKDVPAGTEFRPWVEAARDSLQESLGGDGEVFSDLDGAFYLYGIAPAMASSLAGYLKGALSHAEQAVVDARAAAKKAEELSQAAKDELDELIKGINQNDVPLIGKVSVRQYPRQPGGPACLLLDLPIGYDEDLHTKVHESGLPLEVSFATGGLELRGVFNGEALGRVLEIIPEHLEEKRRAHQALQESRTKAISTFSTALQAAGILVSTDGNDFT